MACSLPYYDAAEIAADLDYPSLIRALNDVFQGQSEAPVRHHHVMDKKASDVQELLMMPAWTDQALSVKLATVFPGNSQKGLPTIAGVILLFDRQTGIPLAVMDAGEVTARRTAAASALASSYLSRNDAQRLLIIGTGRLASYLAEAHLEARDLTHISIWGRDRQKAEQVLANLPEQVLKSCQLTLVDELAEAVSEADIISLATRSTIPIVESTWLSAGTHLDLVGGYRPDMREVDNGCIKMASLFADTRAGVLAEAGDLIQPIQAGVITAEAIQADLHDLCCGVHVGRSHTEEITLFKSVGSALEDLAAATLLTKKRAEHD